MTDELEKKLLEEIDKLSYHKDHSTCPECNLCGTCEIQLKPKQERLSQHRQTKKWIEGLIDKMFIPDERFKYFAEELKKQISGAKK